MPETEKPTKVQLRNTVTGEVVFVRFGSAELERLRGIAHPDGGGRFLYEQVYDFSHRWT